MSLGEGGGGRGAGGRFFLFFFSRLSLFLVAGRNRQRPDLLSITGGG